MARTAKCSLLHLVKTRRNITNTLMVFANPFGAARASETGGTLKRD
jgi:hypothetical protein